MLVQSWRVNFVWHCTWDLFFLCCQWMLCCGVFVMLPCLQVLSKFVSLELINPWVFIVQLLSNLSPLINLEKSRSPGLCLGLYLNLVLAPQLYILWAGPLYLLVIRSCFALLLVSSSAWCHVSFTNWCSLLLNQYGSATCNLFCERLLQDQV